MTSESCSAIAVANVVKLRNKDSDLMTQVKSRSHSNISYLRSINTGTEYSVDILAIPLQKAAPLARLFPQKEIIHHCCGAKHVFYLNILTDEQI